MGQGLGKYSPIVLSFGRENYEALIERHGQFVRWRVASKCTCVKKNTFQPDVHCSKCGGRGYTYNVQKNAIVSQIVLCTDNSGILEVNSEYENCKLITVYDRSGTRYNAEKNGCFIAIDQDITPVKKGEYITILMDQIQIYNIEKAECESLGYGYYRINGLRVRRNGIDGIFYDSPCDILSIGKIIDGAGTEYKAIELRQDTFYIEPETEFNDNLEEVEKPIVEPLTIENVDYIPPNVFALVNQNINKSDAAAMVEVNGDAVCTFPYRFDVAENDVITALSGSYIRKETVNRIAAEYDTLSAFFVDSVIELKGKTRDFKQGIDFLLLGTNRIKWICEDAPEDGETYSIAYKIFPTYVVVKSIPQLRTSEDQRLPKKVIVKLFNTYSEMAKINRQ